MEIVEIKIMEGLEGNIVLSGGTITVSKKLWDKVGEPLHQEFRSLLCEAYNEMNSMHEKFKDDPEKPSDEEIESAVLTDGVFPWLKLHGIEVA